MEIVGIIDYKLNNLGSVYRAVEECGAQAIIVNPFDSFDSLTHIILPGVGAFGDGIENLKKFGFEEKIKSFIQERPLLGICLGMQLLAKESEEFGKNIGLELMDGKVILFDSKTCPSIPHIGWNNLVSQKSHFLLDKIEVQSDFYFVHSYHYTMITKDHVIAECNHGINFPAVVANNNIYGAQFHPEKSGKAGLQFLKNFIYLS